MWCRGGELRGVSTEQWIDLICLIRLKIIGWARAFDPEWRLLSPLGRGWVRGFLAIGLAAGRLWSASRPLT